MTSKFDGLEPDSAAKPQNSEADSRSLRFELLSAYIDGELSPLETKQVQTWLDCDPEFKQLYMQLLALQGQIKHSVAPPSEKCVTEITAEVFQSLDRRRNWRRKLVWGGAAIAASVVAGISGMIPGVGFSPRIAEVDALNPTSRQVMLAVAVDRPAIIIPKSVSGYSQPNLDLKQNQPPYLKNRPRQQQDERSL